MKSDARHDGLRAIALLLAGLPFVSMAQDAGTLLRQQEQQMPRPLPEKTPELGRESLRTIPAEPGKITVRLKAVKFTGAVHLVPEAQLQEAVADAIGQDLDLAGLQQLAERITNLLKAQGWFLGRAYLPKQDVTSGILEIRLVAGQLSRSETVRITDASKAALRIDPARLRAIADVSLRPGADAREDEMERPVLLMGDLPGITAKARIEPGAELESTKVLIDVEEGPLLSGSLSLDSYGNRSTGLLQQSGLLNLNDPLRIGDQLSLGFIHAEGSEMGRLSYSLPLGSNGTRLAANASQLAYRHVEGLGESAGLKGTASSLGFVLSHPLIRGRVANLNLETGMMRKALEDNSSVGNLHDKIVDVVSFGIHADRFDNLGGGGLTLVNLTYSRGRLDMSRNAVDAADDALAYRTDGQFGRWNWGVTRLQKLPAALTLYANLIGQSAKNNLGSSEQFILGGPYGVRAYPSGEASGDLGWLASLELRHDLPGGGDWGTMQLSGFYDTGRITLHQDTRGIIAPTASGRNTYALSGWGLGLQLNKTGQHILRLTWAQKIGSNPGRTLQGMDADGRHDRSRLWFTGTLFF